MIRTRVGYTGGTLTDPTYRGLGDHTESIQVEYDPQRVSYAELLKVYWAGHDPFSRGWSRQYQNAVYYHDEEQRRAVEETVRHREENSGAKVRTQILAATRFYRAEDYHQKYRLRNNRDLFSELRTSFPDETGFTDSTAAARINGYLGGHGTLAQFDAELPDLGLGPRGRRSLRKLAAPLLR